MREQATVGEEQRKWLADNLAKLPGTIKVQYGKDWIERFYSFTNLLSIVVFLSGSLLILTTVFMVAYTIRLTIVGRPGQRIPPPRGILV